MGNKLALDSCKPFEWGEEFQIIDSNLHDNFLSVRSLTTREQFIGKELISASEAETNHIESLISKKINSKSVKVLNLVWSHRIKDISYCSYQTKFYLAFQKYDINLKEEKIRRQFNGSIFSEEQISEILYSVVRGLIYLRSLAQPHQRICLQNIFLREDRTVMLSDPWLFSKEYASIYTFHLNGFIYPSPEKILYENDMIDGYDPYLSDYYSLGVMALELIHLEQMDIIYEKGFRRIQEDTIQKLISKVQSQNLRKKLQILLSYDPVSRQFIEKMENPNQNCLIKSKVKNVTTDYKQKSQFLVRRESQLKREGSQMESSEVKQEFIKNERNNQQIRFVQDTNHLIPHQLGQNNYLLPTPSFSTPTYSQPSRPKIIFNHHVQHQNQHQDFYPQQKLQTNHFKKISREVISNNKTQDVRSQQKFNFGELMQPQQHFAKVEEKKDQYKQKIPNSSISIQQQIKRIIKNLKGQQDLETNKTLSRTFSHQPKIKINQVESISREPSQSYNEKNINTSQNYLSIKDSYNVKTSFSAQNTPRKPQQCQIPSKPESQYSIKEMKHLTSMGQVFKETQSINQSFDERSENSVVLGHRFSSKDSSMFMNFKPENSQQKVTMSEHKELPAIEENNHFQNEEIQGKAKNDDETKTEESRHQYLKTEEFQTPEQRPAQKRYNSTIKEVSEDEPSIQSVQNDYEEKVIEYAVGTKYVGQTKNGKRWGRGIYYYVDGSYYQGQWKDNKMHGKGSLYYSKGSLAYEGGWYMDTFHGKGRIYNDSPQSLSPNEQIDYRHLTHNIIDNYWYIYEGDFFFEQKHGKGKIKLSNGEAYIGEWNQDQINGRGKFYRLNGDVIQGKWSNGKLVEEYV